MRIRQECYVLFSITSAWLVGWLVFFLQHMNLCRVFNAKSIFLQITSSFSNVLLPSQLGL